MRTHVLPDEARGSRSDTLAYVRRRGLKIRRQRRMAQGAVAGGGIGVVIAIAIAVATLQGPTGPLENIGKIAPAARPTPETSQAPAATAEPSRAPSASPVVTPSPAPRATPTPTPLPECGEADVSATVATDKTAYAKGENVLVSTTVTNTSGHACTIPAYVTFDIVNGANAPVGGSVQDFRTADRTWAAGTTYSASLTWTVPADAQPGTHRATSYWKYAAPFKSATSSFEVTA